jgi:hypothetical protein
VLLLVVVLWVWANVEATAKPKTATIAPSESNVFISDRGKFGVNLVRADTQESLFVVAADVKTTGGIVKMISL